MGQQPFLAATHGGALHNNELVLRIQPDEAVYLRLMSKVPGLEFMPAETELQLSFKSRYPSHPPPEAYARLILDVLKGDQSQFVRSDELVAAWAIFTPLLHAIDAGRAPPHLYPYGSRGPPQSDKLIGRYGYVYEGGSYAGEWRAVEGGKAHGIGGEVGGPALRALREEFALPTERLRTICKAFCSEMHRGLVGDAAASIKMIPSFVTQLPSGLEKGGFWAIDVGGSNLRVLEVLLDGAGGVGRGREVKMVIPQDVMTGRGEELFNFIADALVTAGARAGDPTGFTFSFPVAQTAVDAGTLIEWTKGFSAPGVVGNDVMEMMHAACLRRNVPVRLVALVNDTVGTLMMRAYGDRAARVGVILGTGTNACYGESLEALLRIPAGYSVP